MLKRWDLSPQQCVAIGDSGNDAEMLKLVKYAFAMGNAADSIKAIAGYATDDNNHDGALNVIRPSSITPALQRLTFAGASRPGFPFCAPQQDFNLALTPF